MKKIIIILVLLINNLTFSGDTITKVATALTFIQDIPDRIDIVNAAIDEMKPKVACFGKKSCPQVKSCNTTQSCTASLLASFIKLMKPIFDSLLGTKEGESGLREGALPLILGMVADNLSGKPLPKGDPKSESYAKIRKELIESKSTKAKTFEYYEKLNQLAISAQDALNYLNAIVRVLAPADAAKDLPPIVIPPVTVAEGDLPDL